MMDENTSLEDFMNDTTKSVEEENKTVAGFEAAVTEQREEILSLFPQLVDAENKTNEMSEEVEYETRSVELSLPLVAWATFDAIGRVFDLQDNAPEEYQPPHDRLEQLLDFLKEKSGNSLPSHHLFVSQGVLGTLIAFTQNVLQAEMSQYVQAALKSGDQEQMLRLIQQLGQFKSPEGE